ncbi:MAG: hypothetical protein ISS16_08765 [Ignavibacteria bacterium]|nr:hypothetical protein [Bacteroidota bacterium]MBL7129061.1 hypothetical protein [Ignavibacteria bacterium]
MEKFNKVAKITLLFWIMKILATTLGETMGDLFSMTLDYGYPISLTFTMSFFLIVLLIQLKVRKFHPVPFWLVIIATTTVGTEISDFIDRTLKLGYIEGSILLFSALMITLFIWYHQEKKLTVYPIYTRKEEIFFWVAVLFSNSLGTAFGDFLTDNLGLSFLNGAFVTAGIIALVVILHYSTRINTILLFWIAFIFTRPFGATFGDLLTKTTDKGGLDLGTIPATLVTAGLLLLLIYYSSHKHNKQNREEII